VSQPGWARNFMNERYIKWYTPYLSREFEMLAYEDGGGLPLILFPTSFGRFHQNKDFGPVGSVSGYVDAGKLTVYCPNAIDDDNIYFNSPNEYLPNTTDPWKYNHMGIIIGTGEWDNTRHESYQPSEILNSKAISIGLMTENGVATIGLLVRHAAPLFVKDLAGS
jgi:esterase/lipase superfamily enzyme